MNISEAPPINFADCGEALSLRIEGKTLNQLSPVDRDLMYRSTIRIGKDYWLRGCLVKDCEQRFATRVDKSQELETNISLGNQALCTGSNVLFELIEG